MKLSCTEARRILAFCLGRAFRIEVSQHDAEAVLLVTPRQEGLGPRRRFSGASFEEALRAVAQAGLARSECIERQIAFHEVDGEGAAPPAPPEPKLAHYRALAEFRYQVRRFVRFSERAASGAGLAPAEHQLLLAIEGLPVSRAPTLPTLAERLCLDADACDGHLRRMSDRGLVRRVAGAGDAVFVLTDDGQELLRRLTLLHRDEMLAVGPTFVAALGSILSDAD